MRKFILLSLFLLSLVALPACKVGLASPAQDYFLEVGKAFTKANLQLLFPDGQFSKDSVQVSKVFEQARLREVLRPKVRAFLTEKGSVILDKANFYASVHWEKAPSPKGEFVRITVFYKNL